MCQCFMTFCIVNEKGMLLVSFGFCLSVASSLLLVVLLVASGAKMYNCCLL